MSKSMLLIFIGFAVVSPSSYAHKAHHHHHPETADHDQDRPEALKDQSIYQIDSTWTNQDGKKTKLSALQGHPMVVAMVYTSCQGACPMTISDLKKIEEGLSPSAKAQVRFAVFSFDSKRDTPHKLKEFAKTRSLDTNRWTLFHGGPGDVRKLSAVLGIRYRKDKNDDFDHSNVITILNPDGIIVHQQVGLRQDPKESITKLTQLADSLTK